MPVVMHTTNEPFAIYLLQQVFNVQLSLDLSVLGNFLPGKPSFLATLTHPPTSLQLFFPLHSCWLLTQRVEGTILLIAYEDLPVLMC